MVGIVAPKRHAKRAVTRNTLKRQTYAVFLLFANQLPKGQYVVRLKAEFARKEFKSATSDALKSAMRAELVSVMGWFIHGAKA